MSQPSPDELDNESFVNYMQQFKPPPPPTKDDTWELQFCRWWGWNWVRKPTSDESKKARAPPPDPKPKKKSFKNLCLCFKSKPENDKDYLDLYRTPSNSKMNVNVQYFVGQEDNPPTKLSVDEKGSFKNVDSVQKKESFKKADSFRNVDSVQKVESFKKADSFRKVDSLKNEVSVKNVATCTSQVCACPTSDNETTTCSECECTNEREGERTLSSANESLEVITIQHPCPGSDEKPFKPSSSNLRQTSCTFNKSSSHFRPTSSTVNNANRPLVASQVLLNEPAELSKRHSSLCKCRTESVPREYKTAEVQTRPSRGSQTGVCCTTKRDGPKPGGTSKRDGPKPGGTSKPDGSKPGGSSKRDGKKEHKKKTVKVYCCHGCNHSNFNMKEQLPINTNVDGTGKGMYNFQEPVKLSKKWELDDKIDLAKLDDFKTFPSLKQIMDPQSTLSDIFNFEKAKLHELTKQLSNVSCKISLDSLNLPVDRQSSTETILNNDLFTSFGTSYDKFINVSADTDFNWFKYFPKDLVSPKLIDIMCDRILSQSSHSINFTEHTNEDFLEPKGKVDSSDYGQQTSYEDLREEYIKTLVSAETMTCTEEHDDTHKPAITTADLLKLISDFESRDYTHFHYCDVFKDEKSRNDPMEKIDEGTLTDETKSNFSLDNICSNCMLMLKSNEISIQTPELNDFSVMKSVLHIGNDEPAKSQIFTINTLITQLGEIDTKANDDRTMTCGPLRSECDKLSPILEKSEEESLSKNPSDDKIKRRKKCVKKSLLPIRKILR